MIFKSFGVAIILFLAYNAKVYFGSPSQAWGQNQFQNNIIKVQDYVYMPQKAPIIVLGSSISAPLIFPTDKFQTLSLRAGSAYEGLKVLQKKLPKPESVVLVEMNTLLLSTKLDDAFADELFSPFFREIRDFLPALQEKNQPVTVIMPAVMEMKGRLFPIKQTPTQKTPSLPAMTNHTPLKPFVVNEKRLEKVKQMVSAIEAGKAKVVFFEVPQDNKYAETEKRKTCIDILHKTFPQNKFIDLPADNDYKTSDGVHLNADGIIKYTNYLQAMLKKENLMP